MVRSMYSGVSGMKAHQSRMDVIGNNIANVNTYGFKGSRATFRDVYYQTLKNASGATTSMGGRNGSQVGYGVQLGGIDIDMGRTSFQMTDKAMDLAIDGEGFFQVMDSDGNKFYTRAGTLLFDPANNLVDAQGNFVLGVSGNPLGRTPTDDKIQLQVPPVPPTRAEATVPIKEVDYTITAQNFTKDGNVSIQFTEGQNMTDGVKCVANVGTAGIVVTVNPNELFRTMDEFNQEVNKAITAACMQTNGKPHPAGDFTIGMDPSDKFPAGGLKGSEICLADFSVKQGKVDGWPTDTIFGGFKPNGKTGSKYSGEGTMTGFNLQYVDATTGWKLTMTSKGADGKDRVYSGTIDSTRTDSGFFTLRNEDAAADPEDYIIFNRPSFAGINREYSKADSAMNPPANPSDPPKPIVDTPPADGTTMLDLNDIVKNKVLNNKVTMTAAAESKALGLASKNIILQGGTPGGPQTINDLSGISIGPDGVITAMHAVLGDITVGRIDLVNFANTSGLSQAGGTYFTSTVNSGEMSYCAPGSDGTGALVAGALELSNVDLSREFSDMITTQRGFQANSRLITVSDQILEELVNLKR